MKSRGSTKERFVGIPHWVMIHTAFRAASHRARALLLDIALQYNGRNNGRLTACAKALKPLGWNSNDALYKAKNELLALGLLIETRRGAKPNKAAWYALSWRPLDVRDGLDIAPRAYVMLDARKAERPAYVVACATKVRPPQDGVEKAKIAPSHGVSGAASAPPHGAVVDTFGPPPTPPYGAYIDLPYLVQRPRGANDE